MVRYHGQDYEDSDDHANDVYASEQRIAHGVMCQNCEFWKSVGDCIKLHLPTKPTGWCYEFKKKVTTPIV